MRAARRILLALTVVVSVVGCGNAADDDTAAPDTDQSDDDASTECVTQGVTDDSVLLGGSIPQSGALAVTEPINAGREAYFDMVNEAGGVNGRTIEWKAYDDQGTPDRTLANTRRLVEEDQVFLLTGTVGTVQGLGVVDYIEDASVPFLFPVSGSSVWSDPLKPLVFGYQPIYPDEARLFANHIASEFEGQAVGVLAQADDAGDEWVDPFEDELEGAGAELVAIERFDTTAQDVSANISNLQGAGAEVVATFSRVDILAKALTEASNRGYDPTFIVSNIGFSRQLFDLVDPALAEGTLVAGYFPQPDEVSDALDEHEQALGSTPVDDFTMLGWSAASTIVEALDQAGEDLSCGSFLAAMESMTDFDNGLAPPVSFSTDDHQAIDAQRFFEVQDGAFEPITELLDPSGAPLS
ncbi:MAG: ABC transporter substrate-binding protein [Acidimicrobiales bacterium]